MPESTPESLPEEPIDWQRGTYYPVGKVVLYEKAKYVCTFGHVSQESWTPTSMQVLWDVCSD